MKRRIQPITIGAAVLAIVTGALLMRPGARTISAAMDSTAVVGKQADGSYLVPTGQRLTPAGIDTPFNGRAADALLSPDKKTLAILTADHLAFFDMATQQMGKARLDGNFGFRGLAWAQDSKTLYVSGSQKTTKNGQDGASVFRVLVASADSATMNGSMRFIANMRIKSHNLYTDAKTAGLALSNDDSKLYVALFNNSTVAVVDVASAFASPSPTDAGGKPAYTEIPVGSSPESVLLSADGSHLYVANRGGRAPKAGDDVDDDDPVVVDPRTAKASSGTLSVVDTKLASSDPDDAVVASIAVGLQPSALALSPDGALLYAADANSDTVSKIATSSSSVVATFRTSPAPGKLADSSPNALTVSPDGNTLYVSLGGDNAIECMNAANGKITGLIPAAWFPMYVDFDRFANRLIVVNCKGIGSLGPEKSYKASTTGAMNPIFGPGGTANANNTYPGHSVYMVQGTVQVIAWPIAKFADHWTRQVGMNNRFDRMQAALTTKPDPFWSRFKHVVLIIKENKTYDQLMGDINTGSGHIGGDPNLVMFGETITPNHHALARQFGLMDNLYCSGSISADGHHWVNESFADDYDERSMNSYPRTYPCCGTDPLSFAPNEFLWQAAMDDGLSFRDYGEYAPLASMKPHEDTSYDDSYQVTADQNEDTIHSKRIVDDVFGANGRGLSRLTYIWFPNDHTAGTRPGYWTPESDLADNDLGLGRFVEAVTHSRKYWRDEPTAIFVVEDDAQGGLDHVDGHRTVGFVISPYNKMKQVIDVNHNQIDMMRTMELMLGLPPLNQFDAAAQPMRDLFDTTLDTTPYVALKNRIPLNNINPPLAALAPEPRHWASVANRLDFSAPDRADPTKLTEILYRHRHPGHAFPPPDASRG